MNRSERGRDQQGAASRLSPLTADSGRFSDPKTCKGKAGCHKKGE